jgi:dolichyl-phosphate-mannose-protein mannosyltransferase
VPVTGSLATAEASADPEQPGTPDTASGTGRAPRHLVRRPPLRERLSPPMPQDGPWGWIGPLIVTAVAAVLRFVNLGSPHVFSFDETYYAKDALSLLRFGYEQETVSNANTQILAGHSNVFTGNAEFVVHPPLGKWVIAIGEWMFGATPFGWRFAPAVLGTLCVLLLARIVRRMTRSTLLGCIAGLLLALDGLAIVLSRTALLDGILAFFVLAAFGCLVIDRDATRARMAAWVEQRSEGGHERRSPGPRLGLRPWRLLAGLFLGMAMATKWNGLFFLVAFGLMTVLWDLGARRAAGIRSPYLATLRRDALPAFVSTVPVAFAVYVLVWVPWLITYPEQKRTWILSMRGPSFLPGRIRALLGYHAQMLQFNTTLQAPHPYAAKAIGWLLLIRPTAFWDQYYNTGQDGCTASKCIREVTSIGTPVLWWAATVALLWLVWRWIGARDWRAGAVLGAVLAGWLPWVIIWRDRTIFTFYSVSFLPFLVIGLTLALGAILGPSGSSNRRRTWGAAIVGGFLLVVLADAAWMWPVWVGDLLSTADWTKRMWFQGWI